MNALPCPFNRDNPFHVMAYIEFIKAYGTHYTTKIVLGGKKIFTTVLTSKAVAELEHESVDISQTLSTDVQVSL